MLFADTVYFLALLNPADQYHRKAVAVNQTASEDLITTQFILTEVGDALRHPAHRARFIELLALLQSQADVEMWLQARNCLAAAVRYMQTAATRNGHSQIAPLSW